MSHQPLERSYSSVELLRAAQTGPAFHAAGAVSQALAEPVRS